MSDDAPSDFDRARRETVRYHEELYAGASLGARGTWLARPHPLIFEAIALLPTGRPLVAYDLGAGIGRHTVPLIEGLPDGSVVHAVDLLASAVRRLEQLAPASGSTRVIAQQADLADVEFDRGIDLVFAFSAIEHLPGASGHPAAAPEGGDGDPAWWRDRPRRRGRPLRSRRDGRAATGAPGERHHRA
ncbi:class I SAM-dependent methyltransferase [Microbacterium sp. KUDC0406]|uniref:class I SAM-dependent methyltransferase n=1 Tax=Microbacterium sp. KUDC0406 TaxID=2909588 RepID=UPI001F1DD60B|nr:class I SAM-dependent methyltransferase [Microbacterium sp. KUDC0406]UJP09613.1 class I SAM-dependent methyltransferase [Microbacterium sp. KUDC0406]